MQSFLLPAVLSVVGGLLGIGLIYEGRARRRSARRYPPLGQLIDVGNHRLHCFVQGTAEPTVIIEQGAGGPSLAWLEVARAASSFARTCLYDRAGYQWSDAVPGPRSLQDRVSDLHALLVKAGVAGPYVLVGHSYGGFLVRLFAHLYPDSVAGLVLVDTPHEQSYCRPEVLSLYSKMAWMLRAAQALSRFGVPRLLTAWLAKPDPTLPPLLSEQLNAFMARREYFAATRDDIRSLEAAAPWLVRPGAFAPLGDLPLAVITHGKPFPGPFAVLESSWREGQEQLTALSTNSVFYVAEKANHMVQQDEPDVVLEAIRGVVVRAQKRASLAGRC